MRGVEPFKVTVCWTDPEGEVPTEALDDHGEASLINDLDLRIEQGGTEYFPWKLDPANPVMLVQLEKAIVFLRGTKVHTHFLVSRFRVKGSGIRLR